MHQRIDRGGIAEVDDVCLRRNPRLAGLRGHALGALGVAVDDDDIGAGCGERDRVAPPMPEAPPVTTAIRSASGPGTRLPRRADDD